MRSAGACVVVLVVSACSPARGEVAAPPELPPLAETQPAPGVIGSAPTPDFDDPPWTEDPSPQTPAAERTTGEDDELFEAGSRAMSQGDVTTGRKLYMQLIQDHPTSPHVPAVFLAFGDYYFDQGDLPTAQQFYEKVLQFPQASVAPFARYKLAWVSFNLADGAKALQRLVEVIGDDTASKSLRAEARKDLPRFYAEVGKPELARTAFAKWVGDAKEVERLVQSLAQVYADQGKERERATLLASP